MPYKNLKILRAVLPLVFSVAVIFYATASIVDSGEYPDRVFYLQCSGDHDKAVELAREYVASEQKKYGDEDKKTLAAKRTLGLALLADAKYDEAIKVLTEALTAEEKLVGPAHPDLKPYLEDLAVLYYTTARYEEGNKYADRSRQIPANK